MVLGNSDAYRKGCGRHLARHLRLTQEANQRSLMPDKRLF
jgi:hypothetical protein